MSYSCTVASNSGNARIQIDVSNADSSPLIGVVRYVGDSWSDLVDSRNMIRKHDFAMHEILLNGNSLKLLVADLVAWLSNPIDIRRQISADRTSDNVELAFSEKSQLISSKEKPCFRYSYHGVGVPSLQIEFIVDQSCIRVFKEELEYALQETGVE